MSVMATLHYRPDEGKIFVTFGQWAGPSLQAHMRPFRINVGARMCRFTFPWWHDEVECIGKELVPWKSTGMGCVWWHTDVFWAPITACVMTSAQFETRWRNQYQPNLGPVQSVPTKFGRDTRWRNQYQPNLGPFQISTNQIWARWRNNWAALLNLLLCCTGALRKTWCNLHHRMDSKKGAKI